LVGLALLLGLLGFPSLALAQPSPLNAKVVWTREDRVYLASLDSVALGPGDLLTFEYRRKVIAAGQVGSVHGGELIFARLTSGSLKSVKQLDRLRVLGERRPLAARARLRVGCPAPSRSNPIFRCGESRAVPPPATGYRLESRRESAYRLVREADSPAAAPWPDTLVVQWFEEAADQEIALERGELDVAVFWPGELSTRMRQEPRWGGALSGTRSRGVVAAFALGIASVGDSSASRPHGQDFERLNRERFRGDLVPYEKAAGWSAASEPAPQSGSPEGLRYVVDPSWPGQQDVERSLNRGKQTATMRDGPAATVRVVYLDVAVSAPESAALSVAERIREAGASPEARRAADSLAAEIRRLSSAGQPVDPDRLGRWLHVLDAALVFAVGCPVVCPTDLQGYVKALGPDALVDLLDCQAASGAP
jgi:hypothetical protein